MGITFQINIMYVGQRIVLILKLISDLMIALKLGSQNYFYNLPFFISIICVVSENINKKKNNSF